MDRIANKKCPACMRLSLHGACSLLKFSFHVIWLLAISSYFYAAHEFCERSTVPSSLFPLFLPQYVCSMATQPDAAQLETAREISNSAARPESMGRMLEDAASSAGEPGTATQPEPKKLRPNIDAADRALVNVARSPSEKKCLFLHECTYAFEPSIRDPGMSTERAYALVVRQEGKTRWRMTLLEGDFTAEQLEQSALEALCLRCTVRGVASNDQAVRQLSGEGGPGKWMCGEKRYKELRTRMEECFPPCQCDFCSASRLTLELGLD